MKVRQFIQFKLLSALLLPPLVIGCASQSGHDGVTTVPEAPPRTVADDAFENGSKAPPTAKTLYAMARILETQGKDSESEFILRRIIKERSDFMPAYCDLAETQMRQRRVEEAIQTLRAGLQLRPREAILINDVGMCQMMKGDYASALETFTQAAAIVPDDARYRSNMAVALGMLGRYKESFALYQQVLPVADAHYNLGVLCEARKDSVRAAEEFRQAKLLKATESSSKTTNNSGKGIDGVGPAKPGVEAMTPAAGQPEVKTAEKIVPSSYRAARSE